RVYGDGSQIRDWLFVDDHCAALDLLLTHGKTGERYCIGGDKNLTNLEMIELIADLMRKLELIDKKEIEIIHTNDRPTDDFRYAIDSEKLKALGWEPDHRKFIERLTETIAWKVLELREAE